MGIFVRGKLLNWLEIKENIKILKKFGVNQFLEVYKNNNSKKYNITWGDEIEHTILENNITPCLIANKLLEILPSNMYSPEYANYMIESIPKTPFDKLEELYMIEDNMINRRNLIENLLKKNQKIANISVPWLLGTENNIKYNKYSESLYCSDDNIYPDERFTGFTKNIRVRKNKKININMKTEDNKNVHMDCMLFGMGCACLQTTFQLEDLNQAKYIYDQFIPFAPIMMALTASTPVIKGRLLNTDCRWSIISQSVDDRTDNELLKIPKSRYSSASFYISEGSNLYNDINFPIDIETYNKLIENSVNKELSQHISHLFIRDPLLLYDSELEYNNNLINHFNNLQSSNWESVRLKLPTNKIGWRVELRTMEIQLKEFENASFVIFIVLLTKTIIKYKLNFYQPISQIDDNMLKAEKMDSVIKEKFLFNLGEIDLVSIKEIIDYCLYWINKYLDEIVDKKVKEELSKNLEFIKKRAYGIEPTNANKIRNFIKKHKKYNNDCIVTESIMNDFIENNFNNKIQSILIAK